MAETNVIWEAFPGSQRSFLSCPAWECLLHGNRGGGKAQPMGSRILTPQGWKRMRDMKAGYRICNPDGTTSTVIGIFPQGKKPTYKVSFVGGGHTLVTEDHLWLAWIANRIKGKQDVTVPLDFEKGRIFTTRQLIDLMELHPHKKPIVPVPQSVKFTPKNYNYSIDPYLLGLLIGDGSFSVKYRVNFTTEDHELEDYVRQFGFEMLDCEHNTLRVTTKSHVFENIQKAKLMGTKSNNKFIPPRYLYGTEQERLAVLQGLMDTDGYATPRGAAVFTTVSKQLATDVRFLAHSLGARTTYNKGKGSYKDKDGNKIICQMAYNIRIIMPNNGDLFRLPRKKERCEGATYQHGYIGRKIKSIKLHKILTCQCIKVNNPNGLYITDDFIVTHNTDVLLMDYLQGVGVGHGIDYAGLLLREATTELGDVIKKTKKWIPRIFPSAKFNNSKKVWTFEGGESLWLNYARVEEDYDQYHGHEYPWIGWEELTNHAFDTIYLKLMSCNRSSNINIINKYRATCNPSGPGHGWVKERFIDATPAGKIMLDEFGQTRTHIRSFLHENKALEAADPLYKAKLMAMTQDNQMLRDAWVKGSWDLVIGGFFSDVWDKTIHVLPSFIPPSSWQGIRSFDWGSSKPWAVTYGWEANGEQPIDIDIPYIPKGSVIIPMEIYGWNGKVNEGDRALSSDIASRVLLMDKLLEQEYGVKISPGPADTAIWDVKDGASIAKSLSTHGLRWTKAYKGPGSRISGWSLARQMLGAAKRQDLENPHLYFIEGHAKHHIRTLPMMQRDKKQPEDLDSDLEDHLMDSLRYLLARKLFKMKRRKVGM